MTAGRTTRLLVLSAPSAEKLAGLARDTAARLARPGGSSLLEVCAHAADGLHATHRLSVTGRTCEEIAARLDAHLAGETVREVHTGIAEEAARVAFLFSGQGAQFAGMGQGLYRTERVYRETFDRCAEAARPFVSTPLQRLLYPDAEPHIVHRTAHGALGTFCVSMALAELWRTRGVEPAAVLGFSSGEYAAAACAGALRVEDAVRLLGTEITLAERITDGAMAVVALDERTALEALRGFESTVGIAAVISPGEVSLSGQATMLARLTDRLRTSGTRVSGLPVPAGLHSPLHEPALAELAAVAEGVHTYPPRVPLISTVSGRPLEAGQLTPVHWGRHMRGPVRFLDAIRVVDAMGIRTFLEVGPGRALVGLGARCLPGGGRLWPASLGRSTDGTGTMLEALGRLYTAGVPVSRSAVGTGARPAH
ncbi:acyltransferase domain-containing protein [Streptomyces sp. 15-116A]|uniref:acyltransferase domain-containing protein n=1 Tax=Streptomyces sp. 15-116A TaxID=2259035 RepID=UPI0021B16463|nr:acyltransferase domain-containing protein [Streptomyces sp. 15-116A]MCT7351149.1 acyltransferase domain-containing protein [Streptomyces sp. 15-116A]